MILLITKNLNIKKWLENKENIWNNKSREKAKNLEMYKVYVALEIVSMI